MRVVVDSETYPFGPGAMSPRMVCAQVWPENGRPEILLATDRDTSKRLAQTLREGTVVLHNAPYDLAVFGQNYPELWPTIWQALDDNRVRCTLIAQKLLDIARGQGIDPRKGAYSLAGLVKRHLDADMTKGEASFQTKFETLDGVPVEDWPSEAKKYALDDLRYTGAVDDWQQAEAISEDLLGNEVRGNFALHLASAWGMRTDPDAVEAYRLRMQAEVDAKRQGLIEAGLLRKDGSRDDKKVRALAAEAGVTKKTPTGQIEVSADTLEEIDHPVLNQLREFLHAQKMLSTYVPVLLRGVTEPLHVYFGMAESLRSTCANPNLQNLPREEGVRECYRPRPGFVFAAADFHVAELVCLAAVCEKWFGASRMGKALREGKDLHLVTAADILRKSYEVTVRLYGEGDAEAEIARALAKVLNFGIPGGLGIKAIMGNVNKALKKFGIVIDEKRAKELREGWFTTYPEVRRYLKQIGALTKGGNWQCRHPITGYVRGGLTYTSGANHLFQHLCAVVAKRACYLVQRACFDPQSVMYGARLCLFVHDELIMEAPLKHAPEVAEELARLMVKAFVDVGVKIPAKAEPLLMDRWSKKAKPVRGVDGRLRVWSPIALA